MFTINEHAVYCVQLWCIVYCAISKAHYVQYCVLCIVYLYCVLLYTVFLSDNKTSQLELQQVDQITFSLGCSLSP